jgi:VanZ family protein
MIEDWVHRGPVHHSRFLAAHVIVCAMIKQILLTPSHARLRYWTAIVLYLLILILGSVPGARQDIGQLASGLILHSLAYAGLTFLLFTGSNGNVTQRALKAVLTIALMGALDECVQGLFPYRHAAVSDWLVDCSAAMLTAGFMWALWSRYRSLPAN